jgi:ankyrin repeat protein
LSLQAVLCEIEAKKSLHAVDAEGLGILHWCSVSEESERLIPELIHTGINLNAVDKLGKTPLHYLAARGRLYGAACLLHNGAEPNIAAESDQSTPLHYAVRFLASLSLPSLPHGHRSPLEMMRW